ncbi:hypothetical protein MMC26_005612 [Xylographa opegraphella]|nr:hypothetical protein [Xylographa opegraphella]
MAKRHLSTTESALPSASTAASSTVTLSSAAIFAVSDLIAASPTISPSSAASSTIAASAASVYPTIPPNLVDNQISPGGIAAATVFSCAVLLSCIYLAYLAYRKFQNHQRYRNNFSDQETAPAADESLAATRPMSYLQFGKLPHDDVIEIVIHHPEQPQFTKPLPQSPGTSTVASSPDSPKEMNSPRLPASLVSPNQQALPPDTPQLTRYSTPLLSSKLYSPFPQPHPYLRSLPSLSPPLPIHLGPLAAPTNNSSPASTRALGPTSATAVLAGHPTPHGRCLGPVSPGLSSERPYPTNPPPTRDGRSPGSLGRKPVEGEALARG